MPDRLFRRCACLSSALFVLLLAACSDPEPGLTAAEFYARAEATRERAIGPGPNGWASFAEVLALHESIANDESLRVGDNPDNWPAMQIDAICFGPFPRPGLEGGLSLLDTLEKAGLFDRLDEALAHPVLFAPWDASQPVYSAYSGAFAHTGHSRGLLRTLRARMRVAAGAGDASEVVRTFQNELALARAVANRCLAIDYLVGVASITIVLQDARHLAVEEKLTPDMIRGMLGAIGVDRLLPPPGAVIDTERDFSLATFVASAKEQGISVNRREWIARIEAAHAAAAANLADPARGPTAAMDGDEFFGVVLHGAADESELFKLLDHAFAMVVDNDRRLGLDLAGTQAVLLVALYRAEHARHPDSLEAVGAPLDPVSGGAFVFRATPPGSTTPFLLYSIGADKTDNGGAEREAGALTPPGPDDAGYDYCFTNPRHPYVGFDNAGEAAGPGAP